MSGVGYPTRRDPTPPPTRTTFWERVWEYVGYPPDETDERRRILFAIVALRLGLGLFFLLRGWPAVFSTDGLGLAGRIGDPARWMLTGAASDTTLFILGCCELGVGLLLIAGVFTRVSAVVGTVLLTLALLLGQFPTLPTNEPLAVTLVAAEQSRQLLPLLIAGLLPMVLGGSPFLSADRALDKVEEEERDRAPERLPRAAQATPLLLRAGVVIAMLWLILVLHHGGLLVGVALLLLIVGLQVRTVAGVGLVGLLWLAVAGRLAGADSGPAWFGVAGVLAALLCTGSGPVSLDHLISRWQRRRAAPPA